MSPALQHPCSPLWGLLPQSALGDSRFIFILISNHLKPPVLLHGVRRLKWDHNVRTLAQNRLPGNIISFQCLFPFHWLRLSRSPRWTVDRPSLQTWIFRKPGFWASANWRTRLSQRHPHMCTDDICCFFHLTLPIFLVKQYSMSPLGNIPVCIFNVCGMNSNSSSRMGSNWCKLGRGEADVAGRFPFEPDFGITSKEGRTCSVLGPKGWRKLGSCLIFWALDKSGPRIQHYLALYHLPWCWLLAGYS